MTGPEHAFKLQVESTRSECRSGAVRTFVLERPDSFSFLPGQYVWLGVPDGVLLPMAVASGVADPRLEFSVRRSEGTEALFELSPGDSVTVSSALGTAFPLDKRPGEAPLLLVAGGTGVTPIRSVLRSLPQAVDFRAVIGARRPSDFLYYDEFSTRPQVELTVDEADGSWQGKRGPVTHHLSPVSADTTAFVCGPDGMMIAVRDALLAAELTPGNVYLSVQAMNDRGEVLGPVLPTDDPVTQRSLAGH